MSEVQAEAAGRPGAGALLADQLAQAADKRPGRRDLRPLRGLWPPVKNHVGDAVLALVFLLCSTAATLGMSGAARIVADKGLGSIADLTRTMLVLGGVVVFLALATAFRFYFVTKLGERVVADLRKTIYDHILTLDQAFFLKTRTGEVLSRMTTDLTIVENMVGTSVSVALRNSLMFVGSLSVLMIITPRYTLLVLGLIPLILLPMFYFGRRVRTRSVRAQDRFAEAVGYAGESLDSLETVQAFGRETTVAERFGQAVELAFATSLSRIRARSFMTALVIMLGFSGMGVVLFLAAKDAFVLHTISNGTFFQFVILAFTAVSSIGQVGEVMGDVQKAAGAMERIEELLQAQPGIAPPAHPVVMPVPARGEITFEHVTFAYPGRPDLTALRDFSLKVRPGERVALVGPSGAGKSTVLRLLLRFYDPQDGAIRIDGVDLKSTAPAEARARIALVGQDAPLFSGSAYENLRFGREEATLEEMRSAADAAQASGFLNALPEGFDTPIGERAKTLSGGQRQRMAIARALVRDAPILLLDEATSALDAENERLVQQALEKAMVGRTTLVIAHRLATVLKADRIIVMDDGHVIEEGVHADLVAKGGLYARLAQLQFGVEAA
jgi:ATP-binding cassette, subfamily B, bacterial